MSLKDKTKEVLEAGKAERGNFTPSGKPRELYSYWLERSDTTRALRVKAGTEKENFCHYWRVVAIWAPLMKLKEKVGPKNLAIGGLVIVALALLGMFGWGLTFPGFREFLLVLVIVFAIAGVALGVAAGAVWLEQNKGFPLQKILNFTFVVLAVGSVLALVVFAHIAAIQAYGLWLGLAAVYGTVVLTAIIIAALIAAGAGVGELISGARALSEKKKSEKYEADPNYVPPTKKAKGFFSSIGDFLVLLGQVVRVNKWKICPLVEIEVKNDDFSRTA